VAKLSGGKILLVIRMSV